MRICIQQFAKTPEPGRVKTRMCPPLGAERAMTLHKNMVEHTLQRATRLDTGALVQLWSTEGGSFIEDLCRDYGAEHCLQRGNDLGERICAAVGEGVRVADAVIVVGSDCPYLNKNYYLEAIEQLSSPACDLVLGPASDGGYVLIGMKSLHPELFRDISWGSGQVLTETRLAISSIGLKAKELAMLDDIDRAEDLARLWSMQEYAHLFNGIGYCP